MKKLLLTVSFIISLFSAKAQLQNTYWEVTDPSSGFSYYFYFGTDTLYFSLDNITYTASSIYNAPAPSFWIHDLPGTTCNVTDTGFYNYVIQNDTLVLTPVTPDPCTDRQDVLAVYYIVQILTEINEIENFESIKIYPNPVTSKEFFIKIPPDKTIDQVVIYDVHGRMLKKLTPDFKSKMRVDVSGFSAGLYFICLLNEENKKTFKIIVK